MKFPKLSNEEKKRIVLYLLDFRFLAGLLFALLGVYITGVSLIIGLIFALFGLMMIFFWQISAQISELKHQLKEKEEVK